MSKPHIGAVPAGTGKLIVTSGTTTTVTSVTTPIALGDGNHTLVDNETNAVITAGNGNNMIMERGTGASITLGNGNNIVTDHAGTATVTTGTGDSIIDLGGSGNTITVGDTAGGTSDRTFIHAGDGNATVTAGNGNMVIEVGGANNTITAGNGNDVIALGHQCRDMDGPGAAKGTPPVSNDTLYLGNGTNMLFLSGSGNTIHDGTGTDTIVGARAGHDTFVLNAAGGTQTISGFSLTNNDALDLTSILKGVSLASDLSNLGTYVSAASIADATHSAWTDTVVTITGTGGTDTVTLLNTGSVTLAGLLSANSLILPAH